MVLILKPQGDKKKPWDYFCKKHGSFFTVLFYTGIIVGGNQRGRQVQTPKYAIVVLIIILRIFCFACFLVPPSPGNLYCHISRTVLALSMVTPRKQPSGDTQQNFFKYLQVFSEIALGSFPKCPGQIQTPKCAIVVRSF